MNSLEDKVTNHPGDRSDDRGKVFLSYSRRDRDEAQRVSQVLRERAFGVFRDTDDILPTEEWKHRLEQLIEEADTIVFLLSPNSVASDVCAWEVEYATSLNKRIAPIVIVEVDTAKIPPLLARLNFIFCTERDRFDDAIDNLVSALNTDIDWIREHTRLHGLCQRWENAGRPDRLLLRGQDVSDAETWRDEKPPEAPEITVLQGAFISESRKYAIRQQKRIVALSLAAGIIAVALMGLAYWQRSIAIEAEGQATASEKTAVKERDSARIAQSLYLADLATQASDAGDASLGVLAALEALKDPTAESALQRDRPYVAAAESSLADALHHLREKAVLTGHTDILENIGFSPDGSVLATTSIDKTARLWRVDTGQPVATLEGHTGWVRDAAFSPDGTRVATASDDGTVRLWDAGTGAPLALFQETRGEVGSVMFSPDGSLVLTGNGSLWDAETHQLRMRLEGDDVDTWRAAFSPDASRIVVIGGSQARLLDAATGEQIAAVEHEDSLDEITYSPDGNMILTTFSEDRAHILHGRSGRKLFTIKGHDAYNAITDAEFSPDSKRVVTTSSDKTARVWDIATGRQILVLRGHEEGVEEAEFSPDGSLILTASIDGTARLWDAASGNPVSILQGHENHVMAARFSPDGRHLATASYDGTVRLWTVQRGAAGTKAATFRGSGGAIYNVEFSSDGSALLFNGNGDHSKPGVQLRDVGTGEELQTFDAETTGVTGSAAAFSPKGDSLLIAGSIVELRDLEGAGQANVFQSRLKARRLPDTTFPPAFSSDGTRAITSRFVGNNTVRITVWNVSEGKEEAAYATSAGLRSAAISPDGGRLIVAGDEGFARLWDVDTGEEIVSLAGHTGSVRSSDFSPDGSLVVTSGGYKDHTVRTWDARTGAPVRTFQGHAGSVNVVTFSPDGTRIASGGSDDQIRIWTVESGLISKVLTGHSNNITTLAFSRDGRFLLSGSEDRTARLWAMETGEQVAIYRGHGDQIRDVALSPDGSRAATGSSDDSVRIWSVFSGAKAIIAAAKNAVPRCLSLQQRRRLHMPEEPPAWCIEMKKWPYDTKAWRDWLTEKQMGNDPALPE